MTWKNRGEPFITLQGTCQRQSKRGETRLRIEYQGMPGGEYIYVRPAYLVDLAEFLDDLCDAVEDGVFDTVSNRVAHAESP